MLEFCVKCQDYKDHAIDEDPKYYTHRCMICGSIFTFKKYEPTQSEEIKNVDSKKTEELASG